VVGQVAFGVDQDGGNALQGSFFQKDDAHTGLAGASHTGDDRVGGQVGGVIEDKFVRQGLFGDKVVLAPEKEF
jgi:hypothetical protein